jgi:hypothetical protein
MKKQGPGQHGNEITSMYDPYWFFREPYVYLLLGFACFSVGVASIFVGKAPMKGTVDRTKDPIVFWFVIAFWCIGGIWMVGYCVYKVSQLSR